MIKDVNKENMSEVRLIEEFIDFTSNEFKNIRAENESIRDSILAKKLKERGIERC